jgi:hypothetical protein
MSYIIFNAMILRNDPMLIRMYSLSSIVLRIYMFSIAQIESFVKLIKHAYLELIFE